jgi:hypothetical protein
MSKLGILLAIAASAALPLRPGATTIAVTTNVDELNVDGDRSPAKRYAPPTPTSR